MSARRRQEVLERFSIPVEVKNTSVMKNRHSIGRVIMDSDDDDAQDRDFIQSDDDHSFLDDSDDDNVRTAKKGKGKAKMKTKSKRINKFDALGGCENPVVMLISLKAGALGLNLTVANNVSVESLGVDRS